MEDFQPVTNNGVTFAIDASPTLYYAKALNQLAFIRELTLDSEETFHDADKAVDKNVVASLGLTIEVMSS